MYYEYIVIGSNPMPTWFYYKLRKSLVWNKYILEILVNSCKSFKLIM